MKFDSSGVRGLPEVVAAMKDFSERRLNAALATALTRTAVDVKKAFQAALPSIFDRPTPYTMNSLKTRAATAERLQSSTYFKDDLRTQAGEQLTQSYLQVHVDAGTRQGKRLEAALRALGALPAGWVTVPGQGAALDAYGNHDRGQIVQMLSQLRLTLTAGHDRNMSFDARKQINAQRKAGGRFFVVAPGAKGGMRPGIYQRELMGRNVTPVVVFVPKASYSKRFDFWGMGQRVAAERLSINARQAVHEQRERLNLKRTG